MDESIYNLVPREYVAPVKPAMHRSSHNPTAPLTGSTFGCKGTSRLLGAGTMVKKEGALFGPRPKPMDENAPTYLVKKTVDNSTAGKSSFSYDKSTKKPPVVPQSEHPVMGIRTTKNFITANAVEAILAAPRVVPESNPNYMKKEDYGKVPSYLSQVKEEIKRENEMIDKYVKDRMGVREKDPEHTEELDEYERQQLISQLKAKWDVVNANYQRMTHVVNLDSVGKMRRKEELENSLKQLESDIEKLQRPGAIIVKNGW